MTRGILIAVGLSIGGWIGTAPRDVLGCAPVTRTGQSVGLADETAFIIWDDANDVEHFVRQATFVGTARDFGFLVPTPNRPQLEPASADIFQELKRITEPKTEHRTETALSFGCAQGSPSAATESTNDDRLSGVVVLEQKRVGKLEAAVLAFRADKTQKLEDTADELLSWLASRGYVVRPDLTDWLAPYIDRNWMITAFKIAGESGSEPPPAGGSMAVKSAAVRLTFKTDRPFFPYREPAAQRDANSRNTPRSLRVFMAAKERMEGTIGESHPWYASTVWANSIADSQRMDLLGKLDLSPDTAMGKWWITEFEDRSNPRPGTDEVYFERSMDRGPVARAPIVVISHKTPWWAGPLAIILLLALGGAGLMVIRNYTRGEDEGRKPDAPPPLPPAPGSVRSKSRDLEPKIDPRPWNS